MFRGYKFDLFLGVVGVGICGLAAMGIVWALRSLTFLFSVMGLSATPAIIAAFVIMIVCAIIIGVRND